MRKYFSVELSLWMVMICALQLTENAKKQNNGPCGDAPEGKKASKVTEDHGNTVRYTCMPHYKPKAGNETIYCDSSHKWVGDPLACEDAVNCKNKIEPCVHGECIESDPSFFCKCSEGYLGGLCDEANGNWGSWMEWSNCSSTCNPGVQLRRRNCDNPKPTKKGLACKGDGLQVKSCSQKNCPPTMFVWCEENSDRCDEGSGQAFCSAKDGSFQCTCLHGVKSVMSDNGTFVRCEDHDECANKSHSCPADSMNCVNTYGSYRCECKEGYADERGTCTDIDECSANIHTCDEKARCANSLGGYACICQDGYRSLSVNGTGFQGECLEMRTLLHGVRGDEKATLKSSVSGETMTYLMVFPPGIPLQDDAGNLQTCKSVYATENGVLLITNLTIDPEVLDTYRHPVAMLTNEPPFSEHSSVCALIAPFWSDSRLNETSKLWFRLFDMDLLIVEEKKSRKYYKKSEEILKLLPANFRPTHVAVVTWSNIQPSWPSHNEKMTFQTVLATDGVRTYVSNIYEDRAMNWRPIYEVPLDVPAYQAATGYYLAGMAPKVWFHQSSGKWSEPFTGTNGENVYRLDKVQFESTGKVGIDTHDFTPTVPYNTSQKYLCLQWFRSTDSISNDDLQKVKSCPPLESDVKQQLNVTWIPIKDGSLSANCYKWRFDFSSGGSFDCCYYTNSSRRPLLHGIKALKMGVGFYYLNKTADQLMKRICCEATTSNYFCGLYAQRRPPTDFSNYEKPANVSVKAGSNMTSTSGKRWSVTGSGEARLLKVNRLGHSLPIFTMTGRFQVENGMTVVTALAIRTENFTLEVYDSPNNRFECFLNGNACKSTATDNVSLELMDTEIRLSTREGTYLRVWFSEDSGLKLEALLSQNLLHNVRHVTSGLLSDFGECSTSSYTSQDQIPCDLHSIAEDKRLSAQEISLFSRTPDGYYEEPMRINKTDHVNASAPVTQDTPSVPDQVDATARVQGADTYEVTVNLAKVSGNVTVENHKGHVQRLKNKISFQVNTKMLDGLAIQVNEGSTSYLIFPDVFICDCAENGKCDIEATDEVVGPFPVQAPCICNATYEGERCEHKIEPCSWNPCFVNVACTDRTNSSLKRVNYECSKCPETLEGDNGEACYHNNPCAVENGSSGAHQCVNATCYNEVIDYRCECWEGYEKSSNPLQCYDINECENPNLCENDGETCVNTLGSYECVGNEVLDEMQVADVNECLENNGGCERRCKNTNGSYYCECEEGFRLLEDGKSCEAIDECEEYGNKHCSQICVDQPREKPFRCECHPRYQLADDYTTCIALFSTVPTTAADTTTPRLTTSISTTTPSIKTTLKTYAATTTSTQQVITKSKRQPTTATTTATTINEMPTSTLGLFDTLTSEDKELWKMMVAIPGFASLSPDEKLRALKLLKLLLSLLRNPDLRAFLRHLAMISSSGDPARRCAELSNSVAHENFDLQAVKRLLSGVDELLKTYTNPKILALMPDFSALLGEDVLPAGLSLGIILKHFDLLLDCIELWNYKPTTEAVKLELQKRETTLELTTVLPEKKLSLSLPWLLAWIAIAATAIVAILFTTIIVGTRFCFKKPKKSAIERKAIARQKKLEKMQQWPKVVMSSYDGMPEKCIQKTIHRSKLLPYQ